MTEQAIIKEKLIYLQGFASAGYALAMHIRFTTPTFLFQTYSSAWLDHYSQKGFVMSDPTVHWGFENRGLRDWADMSNEDPVGVLTAAADHGLKYGITCSVGAEGSPSLGSFARGDRPFNESEKAELKDLMVEMHGLTDNIKVLSPETAEALTDLSIQYTHPAKN